MKINNWQERVGGDLYLQVSEEEFERIMNILGKDYEVLKEIAERKVKLSLNRLEHQVDNARRFAGNLRCDDFFKKDDFDTALQDFCTAFNEFLEIAKDKDRSCSDND